MRRLLFAFTVLLIVGISFAQESCSALNSETVNTTLKDCTLDVGTSCAVDSPNNSLEGSIKAPAVFALAGDNEHPVEAWLVGTASVENIQVAKTQVHFDAHNKAGYNVNLRSGPGTSYDKAGVLSFDESAVADARNLDGTWVRLITEQEGIVWVAASFVTIDGDVMSLPVATGNEVLNTQELTLHSSDCVDEPSGLLIIYEGLSPSELIINSYSLEFTGAVAFVSVEDLGLELSVIEGEVQAGSGDNAITLETGQSTIIGEKAAEIQALDLSLPAKLPLSDLLDIPVTCIAEITVDTELRSSPEADSDSLMSISAGQYGAVEARNDDSTWWRITIGTNSGWVTNDSVSLTGDCDAIESYNSGQGAGAITSSNPETVMLNYLQARVAGNVSRMQQLSCAAWDGQAVIQAQSFRAMKASLDNVVCSTTANDGNTATVLCSGNIVTEYNGQTRTWALGAYRMVQEGGAWRMCGES